LEKFNKHDKLPQWIFFYLKIFENALTYFQRIFKDSRMNKLMTKSKLDYGQWLAVRFSNERVWNMLSNLFILASTDSDAHVLRHISNMGRFRQGLQREKNLNCHKYTTFLASFLCFHGQKEILIFFKYPSLTFFFFFCHLKAFNK
jgi:hypothetical protein